MNPEPSAVKLPVKLGREPLVDAIFELRFQSSVNAAGVLPGLLYGGLSGVGRIEPLAVAQLPEQLRAVDPQLRYAALSRLHWQRFLILVGQYSVGVACKMPYPGWAEFRPAIDHVLQKLVTTPFITLVERCSLKYVNLIEVNSHAEAFGNFNIGVRLGSHVIEAENTNLRVEIPRDGFLHAVSMSTAASVVIDGVPTPKKGALLDVDSLAMDLNLPMEKFMAETSMLLDRLHRSNHEVFFECLSESGLNRLEPKYE